MFAGNVKAEDGSRRDKTIQAEKSRMIEDGRPPDWFTKFAAKKKINVIEGHLENDGGGTEAVRWLCFVGTSFSCDTSLRSSHLCCHPRHRARLQGARRQLEQHRQAVGYRIQAAIPWTFCRKSRPSAATWRATQMCECISVGDFFFDVCPLTM
jgi:hypothetical protein